MATEIVTKKHELQTTTNEVPPHIGTVDIPNQLNFYTYLKTFYLGRHADEKLFSASFGWGMLGRTVMTLYHGPSKYHPVMVTSTHKGSTYTITVACGPDPVTVKHGKVKGDGIEFRLEKKAGGQYILSSAEPGDAVKGSGSSDVKRTRLEWRRGEQGKIRKNFGCNCSAWRLVRVVDSAATDGSDEIDMLARVEHASMSMRKSAIFTFLDIPAAEAMGQSWRLVVLLSGLLLWYKDYSAMVAVTAAAVA